MIRSFAVFHSTRNQHATVTKDGCCIKLSILPNAVSRGSERPRGRIVKNDVSIFAADEKDFPRAKYGGGPNRRDTWSSRQRERSGSRVIYLGGRYRHRTRGRIAFTAANNQYRPVSKKHGLVSPPFVVQFANFRKGVGRRVIDFRCFTQGRRIAAANDEYAPIPQQSSRMASSTGNPTRKLT